MFYYSQNCNTLNLAKGKHLSVNKATGIQFRTMRAINLSIVSSSNVLNNYTTNKK